MYTIREESTPVHAQADGWRTRAREGSCRRVAAPRPPLRTGSARGFALIKNIVDYLEATEARHGSKIAYADEQGAVTFSQVRQHAQLIASALLKKVAPRSPVLVYMEKSVACIEAFLGVAYAGAFYVPIDVHMPADRVGLVVDTLEAGVVLTRQADTLPQELQARLDVIVVEDVLANGTVDKQGIAQRQCQAIDMDPCYAIFTSGSTGMPKGVLISQRSVINFTEWWCETFEFTSDEVFANQTPFYFDASVKDIYATLRCGATMHIVPKKLFSFPALLVSFLNEHGITCIDWVPSALCSLVNLHALDEEVPTHLRKVMFLGEVMPTKQFNMWRRILPDVKYANLYGPTEATGDCTYYKIERELADDEPIPIGHACNNTQVMLLDGDRLVQEPNEVGEICVRGCSLALGYYNDPQKTAQAFVQNPLVSSYADRIYRTGDLGRYNEHGEIVFLSRKDSQIKHMGHRIELGEIETALGSHEGVRRACCLYGGQGQRIVAVYEGDVRRRDLIRHLKTKLPKYMIPTSFKQVEQMPINPNGKIDRVLLKKTYLEA